MTGISFPCRLVRQIHNSRGILSGETFSRKEIAVASPADLAALLSRGEEQGRVPYRWDGHQRCWVAFVPDAPPGTWEYTLTPAS